MANVSAELAASVRQMIMGFRTTQILHVAAKLGVADALVAGPRTSDQIAAASGAAPRSVYRLLRALAALGMLRESPGERFELTDLGEALRSDVPGSLHGLALLHGEEWLWSAYGRMLQSVTTGETAFEQVHGASLYAYLAAHPEAADSFDRAMTGYTEQETAAILAAYDFSFARKVVDVGGGRGGLLAAVLAAHPQIHGALMDRPEVLAGAPPLLARAGVVDRCDVAPGSFFETVPGGGDLYVLKSILHNWDDARSIAILRTCRAAMAPDAKLLVIERLVPEQDGPSEAKLFDINMLVVLGGRERTEREYRTIFEEAGLQLVRVVATRSPMSLLEARGL